MGIEITEEEIQIRIAADESQARRLLFAHLANAAHQIKYEIADGESFVFDFCRLVRPQLRNLGIQAGKAWNNQVLLALARAGGPIRYSKGSDLDPSRLTKSLIVAVCNECRRRNDRWQAGEDELERRASLKGIHSFIWRLRDKGVLNMTPELTSRDQLPRFP